jgi:hypothetical protein
VDLCVLILPVKSLAPVSSRCAGHSIFHLTTAFCLKHVRCSLITVRERKFPVLKILVYFASGV